MRPISNGRLLTSKYYVWWLAAELRRCAARQRGLGGVGSSKSHGFTLACHDITAIQRNEELGESSIQATKDAFYVMGGRQRRLRPLSAGNQTWEGYGQGIIVQVDPIGPHLNVCVEYESPPDVRAPEDPEILFQAGTVSGSKLYACTGTEVLIYSLPSFARLGYISLPWFNDVHHVRPTESGTLLVASAGLEMIIEVTIEGEVQNVWNVLGEDPWERFSPDTDYRRVGSTKPHRSHPNYIFTIRDEVWVTRFQQGDAMCLSDQSKRVKVCDERIHDGVVYRDHVYFTTVNGTVVVMSIQSLNVEEVIDLTRMHDEDTMLGWCRALMFEDDSMWVGFSRIRPTKVRENVAWLMRGFKQTRGTHLACYDLNKKTCTADIDLEPIGLNAVFSIFRAPTAKT
jgi:hypothetical protein